MGAKPKIPLKVRLLVGNLLDYPILGFSFSVPAIKLCLQVIWPFKRSLPKKKAEWWHCPYEIPFQIVPRILFFFYYFWIRDMKSVFLADLFPFILLCCLFWPKKESKGNTGNTLREVLSPLLTVSVQKNCKNSHRAWP